MESKYNITVFQIAMYYMILCFCLLTIPTKSQDVKPFGDELMYWVTNEATNESKSMCEADYPNRIQVTLALTYDNLYRSISEADSLLGQLYSHIALIENEFNGKDSIITAVERSADAKTINLLLLAFESKFIQIKGLSHDLDSIGGRTFFTYYGITHVGRENILESYVALGNSLAETFNLKFDNSFYVSVSSDGSSQIQGGGSISMYATTGTAIGAYGGPWGALAGGLIGASVGWFIDHDRQEKIEKEVEHQKSVLDQAIRLLPSKLLDGEQMFAIYKSSYDTIALSHKFKKMHEQTDTLLNTIYSSWKSIYLWNIQRLSISTLQLSNDKIKYLQNQYKTDITIRKLFDANFQQKFIIDMEVELSRLINQKFSILNADHLTSDLLEKYENFSDELYFFQTLLKNLLNDVQLIPNRDFISEKLEFVNREIGNLQRYLAAIKSKPIAFLNRTSMPVRNFQSLYTKVALSSIYEERENTNSSGSVGFSICATGSNYYFCFGGNNSYRDRFENSGNNPLTNVYGSSHDGGIVQYNAIATQQVQGLRRNLYERKQRLQHDYSSFTQALDDQVSAILPKYEQVNKSLKQTKDDGQAASEIFFSMNQEKLQQYKDKLDKFAQIGFGDYTSQQLINDLNLKSSVESQVPVDHLSGTDINIAGINFNSYSWKAKSKEEKEFIRETFKQNKAITEIEQRVTNNIANGKTDPVFSDKNQFTQFQGSLEATNVFINELINNDQLPYSPEIKQKLLNHYTKQIRTGRLYAQNNYPSVTSPLKNYPIISPEQTNSLKRLVQDYKSCNTSNCEMIPAKAIFELNGDQWFFKERRPDGRYNGPIDIYKKVSQSSDWNFLGYGNTQLTINNASALATLGYTVIAFNPDGFNTEAGVLLPGLPYQQGSGGWEKLTQPNILRFSKKDPSSSIYDTKLSDLSKDPGGIVFFSKPPAVQYNNLDIRNISSGSISSSFHYDPDIGTMESSALYLKIQYKDGTGKLKTIKCIISINGNYVERIKQDFGNHAANVYQQIFDSRQALFADPHLEIPEDLSSSQQSELKNIKNAVSNLDLICQPSIHPANLYYSQAIHNLYNTCINEIACTSISEERTQIIESSSAIAEALYSVVKNGLDIATALTPGVNDARDWYELVTGNDMIGGEKLDTWERVFAGVGVVAGSGFLYRNIIKSISNKEARTILTESIKGIPGMKYIKEGELSRQFISDEGLVYRNWDLTPGLKWNERESRIKHLLRRHTDWLEGRRPPEWLTQGRGSEFLVEKETEVFQLIDEAWKIKKDKNITHIGLSPSGYRTYEIDLGRQVGDVKNQTAIRIFTENRDDYPWIRSAFAVKPKP